MGFDLLDPISWSHSGPWYLGALLAGYLIGSIPFGYIFAQLAGAGDIRKLGSGNVGATNVLRTGKRWAAAATLICDSGKGALAALIGWWLFGPAIMLLAGAGAFLGHLFPVWLGFRGGKGVATYLGLLLAWHWPSGLAFAAIWLAMAGLFRISSLAALTATALMPVSLILWGEHLTATFAAVLGVVIFIMHRANLARLFSGTEPKIGAKG